MSEFEDKVVMDAWACRHYAVHGHNPLALRDPDTAEGVMFFEEWREAFVRRGVTKAEADRASAYLLGNPPRHPSEHFASLLAAVEIERKAVRAEQEGRRCHARYKADMRLAAAQDRLLAAFRELPEAERRAWVDGVIAETPILARLGDWADRIASEAWGRSVGKIEAVMDSTAA